MKYILKIDDSDIRNLADSCAGICDNPKLQARKFEHILRDWLQAIVSREELNHGK